MDKSWAISIVDDDEPARRALSFVMATKGYRVTTYVDALDYLERQTTEQSVLISDIRMPGMDGIELTRLVKARDASQPIILITGHYSPELRREAMRAGADVMLEKPIEFAGLLAAIAWLTDRATESLAVRVQSTA